MWSRRRRKKKLEQPRPPQVTDGIIAARQAREISRHGLLSAIASGSEAREVAERVAEHGRNNHFGDKIRAALHGGRST